MRRSRIAFAFAFAILAIIPGCPKQDQAGQPSPNPPTATPPPSTPPGGPAAPAAAWEACQADADCEIVEMACCDECNGGWSLSIGKAHVQELSAQYQQKDCAGTMCTEMACGPSTALCKAGRCARREAGFDGSSREIDNHLPSTSAAP